MPQLDKQSFMISRSRFFSSIKRSRILGFLKFSPSLLLCIPHPVDRSRSVLFFVFHYGKNGFLSCLTFEGFHLHGGPRPLFFLFKNGLLWGSSLGHFLSFASLRRGHTLCCIYGSFGGTVWRWQRSYILQLVGKLAAISKLAIPEGRRFRPRTIHSPGPRKGGGPRTFNLIHMEWLVDWEMAQSRSLIFDPKPGSAAARGNRGGSWSTIPGRSWSKRDQGPQNSRLPCLQNKKKWRGNCVIFYRRIPRLQLNTI